MARFRLRSSDQAFPLRMALGLVDFLASLQLAVMLIATFIVLLFGATLIDHLYGDKSRAVTFGIYGTWWFMLLNGLLGLNVLMAAVVRFPWKRAQTGFVITHAGILVLLAGSAVSAWQGIDATLSAFEGESAWRAVSDGQHFELTIRPDAPPGTQPLAEETSVRVPFKSGPFNWDEYDRLTWLPWAKDRLCVFPWALAHRNAGRLYDADGVRLEVLDYLSDSQSLAVPRVQLRVGTPAELERRAAGGARPVSLSVRQNVGIGVERPTGFGERTQRGHGEDVGFWMTDNPAEVRAFLAAKPEAPLGALGQLVLTARGQTFRFPVEKLAEAKTQPLGDTGLSLEGVQFEPRLLSIRFRVRAADGLTDNLVLFSQRPEMSFQGRQLQVYGDYWLDAPAPNNAEQEAENARPAAVRVDLLLGPDPAGTGQRLFYRTFRGGQVVAAGEMPTSGRPQPLWTVTDKQSAASAMAIDVLDARPRPEMLALPRPFNRNKDRTQKRPQAKLRLTVDGQSEEFWLGSFGGAGDDGQPAVQQKTVHGNGRRASVTLNWDEIDVGFRVLVHKFRRELDPGTSRASHYSSLVDLLDRDTDKVLQKNVPITLNQPIDFSDPHSGRSYRLFQASFSGPYHPGDPEYEQVVAGRDLRDELFLSQFSVNYDPGRGLKYAGCMLIVAGTFIMFYMRSYFFRKDRPVAKTESRVAEAAGRKAEASV